MGNVGDAKATSRNEVGSSLVVLHVAPRVKTYQVARLQMTSHPFFYCLSRHKAAFTCLGNITAFFDPPVLKWGCATLDNNSTLLNKPYFLHCKWFERNKTWHSVFYSYFLPSRTGPLILCLCHFVSFHFWPCHLNYKQILCTSQLLFCHPPPQNCSSHPSLYRLLDVLFTHAVAVMVDILCYKGICSFRKCPVQASLIELGCSCRFHRISIC